jgi:hypothetical protein
MADLGQQMEGGGTKQEHLERIEKQTGREQLPNIEIPIEGVHIWNWFWDLSNHRPAGFGISFIPYSEYQAWLNVRMPFIYDWELEILMKMDQAFIKAYQDQDVIKKNKK